MASKAQQALNLTQHIPSEILILIFTYSDSRKDLLNTILTCQKFNQLYKYSQDQLRLAVLCNEFSYDGVNMAMGLVRFPISCSCNEDVLIEMPDCMNQPSPLEVELVRQIDAPTSASDCAIIKEQINLWQSHPDFIGRPCTEQRAESMGRYFNAAVAHLGAARDLIEDYAYKCLQIGPADVSANAHAPDESSVLPSYTASHLTHVARAPVSNIYSTLSYEERRRFIRAVMRSELVKQLHVHTGSRDDCALFLCHLPDVEVEQVRAVWEHSERLWYMLIFKIFDVPVSKWEPNSFVHRRNWWKHVHLTERKGIMKSYNIGPGSVGMYLGASLHTLIHTLKQGDSEALDDEMWAMLHDGLLGGTFDDRYFHIDYVIYRPTESQLRNRLLRMKRRSIKAGAQPSFEEDSDDSDTSNGFFEEYLSVFTTSNTDWPKSWPATNTADRRLEYILRRTGYIFWDRQRAPNLRFERKLKNSLGLPMRTLSRFFFDDGGVACLSVEPKPNDETTEIRMYGFPFADSIVLDAKWRDKFPRETRRRVDGRVLGMHELRSIKLASEYL